jgi:hypothetical protein
VDAGVRLGAELPPKPPPPPVCDAQCRLLKKTKKEREQLEHDAKTKLTR